MIGKAPGVPGAGPLDAVMLRNNDRFGLVHFRLPPGENIGEHSMPFEVVFIALEGEGWLDSGTAEFLVSAGSSIPCGAGEPRAWRNEGRTDLRVLVMKLKDSNKTGGRTMEIRRISEQPQAKNPHGIDVRRAYESEFALSSVITLQPGEKLIRHITPVDVFFYVLEGTGIVEVGEEKESVSQDTVIDSPKDIPHCWYNESADPLRVLVVKVPRPTSGSKLL